MKAFVIYLSFLLISVRGNSQDPLIEGCASRAFYEKQFDYFERFQGKISILDNQFIKYDENVIRISNSDSSTRLIFELGIIYPEIIASTPTNGKDLEFDSLTHKIKPWILLSGKDSLMISSVQQIPLKTPAIKTKRFQFHQLRKRIANPSLYYFELTNDKATKETDLRTFILGSKLTLFKFCSILI